MVIVDAVVKGLSALCGYSVRREKPFGKMAAVERRAIVTLLHYCVLQTA
jgi:hypothetical protein